MTSSDELRPCPFCGLEPEMEPWHGSGLNSTRIGCNADFCPVGVGVVRPSQRGAIKAWNTRPIEDALRAEVDMLKVAEGEAMLVVESQDASIAALKAELAKYTVPLTYEQAAIVCNDYRLGVLTEGDVDEIDAAIRRVRAQSMNEASHE